MLRHCYTVSKSLKKVLFTQQSGLHMGMSACQSSVTKYFTCSQSSFSNSGYAQTLTILQLEKKKGKKVWL